MLEVGKPSSDKDRRACPRKIKIVRCFISGCLILFFIKMKSRMPKKINKNI